MAFVPVHVRAAGLDDVPEIRECYVRSWREAYAADLPHVVLASAIEERRAHDWPVAIGRSTSGVFVADDGGVVGVVQVDEVLPAPRDKPEITMLYVDPRVWGTGTASRLLGVAEQWIASRGHRQARLRVVERHHRARRFYEREGWALDPDFEPASNEWFRLVYYRRALESRS
jgi:GNAT superfamily N-acetyltransferase